MYHAIAVFCACAISFGVLCVNWLIEHPNPNRR